MEFVLSDWLKLVDDDAPKYERFDLYIMDEATEASEEIIEILASKLIREIISPDLLDQYLNRLGWDYTADVVHQVLAESETLQKGDFGEVLSGWVLEDFHELIIPVNKIRYKILGEQSLPAPDIFAIELDDDGNLSQSYFIEVKLRGAKDNYCACDAHDQLRDSFNSIQPPILHFVSSRLFETDQDLHNVFMDYLSSRQDEDLDSFKICLVYEENEWDEKALINLDQKPPDLDNLSVHSVLINPLSDLVDRVYAEAMAKKG